MLERVRAIRYVTPLREGGSLPGVIEADDLGTYVVKFHGAGQGRKTLVAEVVVGELARRLGLAVPRLAVIEVDPAMAASEPDEEVQDLLRASAGWNLAMDYLPGSIGFDPVAFEVAPELAARVCWLDAFVGNVDRSWRNPNLLLWHQRLYLIDHGASLIFHHHWAGAQAWPARGYAAAGEHALARFLRPGAVEAVDAELASAVDAGLLGEVLDLVPREWLVGEDGFGSLAELRAAYVDLLRRRLAGREAWLGSLLAQVCA